jgi:ketosteroid isomerase-like protein
MSRRIFNPDIYEGHAGMSRLQRDIEQVWDAFVMRPERFIDAGERVVVISRLLGRGRESGVEVGGSRTASIWTVRGGQVIHMEAFLDPQEALKAVELSE